MELITKQLFRALRILDEQYFDNFFLFLVKIHVLATFAAKRANNIHDSTRHLLTSHSKSANVSEFYRIKYEN